jgi:hypothetical protein
MDSNKCTISVMNVPMTHTPTELSFHLKIDLLQMTAGVLGMYMMQYQQYCLKWTI